MSHLPSLSRRAALLGLAGGLSLGRSRLAMAAAPTARAGDARLVVVLLRGALDGLSPVQPYAEANFAELRGPLALPEPGREGGLLDLGGRFGLHPAMARLHAMYAAGQLLPVHAVAGHYRSRSHFDAQDYLESGAGQRLTSGWLNRALSAMPGGEGGSRPGIAVGVDVPLLMRGPVRVGSYAPPGNARVDTDTMARLVALHRADPLLGAPFVEGLRARGFSAAVLAGSAAPPGDRNGFVALASAAGRLMAAPQGPRVAALEIGGWDTHAGQAPRLANLLRDLDTGLDGLRLGLGDAWGRTVVLVATEFGRTVRVNGTGGTDHGTAGVAFILGGAVAGGRVLANWPGLADLFENRDLAPTMDLRSLAKGLLRDHLRLPAAALAEAFPGSGDAAPQAGLVRG